MVSTSSSKCDSSLLKKKRAGWSLVSLQWPQDYHLQSRDSNKQLCGLLCIERINVIHDKMGMFCTYDQLMILTNVQANPIKKL